MLFLLDPTQDRYLYSPGLAGAFPVPVIGVVTKTDLANADQLLIGKERLELAGADPVLFVSAVTGEGIDALARLL